MGHKEISKPTDITIPSTSLWAKLPMLGGVLALVGLGATLGAAMGEAGRARAMFSYLWAFEACLAFALGGLGWVLIDHNVRSGWSTVIRRLGETAAATLPLFFVLWIPIGTIGFHSLYPWTHEHDAVLESKRWFLNDGFFFGRTVFYFVVWAALGTFLHRNSVAIDSMTDDAGRAARIRRAWQVSAVGIALYALTQSFQAVDWMMSLQPHWYSTIFGVYYFAQSMLAIFAFMALVALGLQRAGVLKSAITTEHFHDLGKFSYGFTVFWAYIAFSQFILIWYANMPEETVFYQVRLQGGWQWISYALPVLHFFLPFFFFLSRHVKRNRTGLAIGASWIILMHLMDMYWLILPNFGTHGEGAHEGHLAFSWTDLTAIVGMAGAFMAVFGYFLAKNKVVCINDPRLPESLAHENF